MNPNVSASYALLSRLASHGVTHCVVSPGSRSTPLAYVAHQLFDTTVVIDERDAGFVALGISESTDRPAIVITTSGSAPTHLYPSVTEAFHSNIPMIVLSADRPPEMRGRGAPQTIDQINLFNTAVRYFADARCPHEESAPEYWSELADALYTSGVDGVRGPVHLNMGMREPLVPDGDEMTSVVPSSETHMEKSERSSTQYFTAEMRSAITNAETVVITLGRNANVSRDAMNFLMENMLWPQLADATSNVRYFPTTMTTYDAVMRQSDAKYFVPDLIIQFGDALTSKMWNEMTAGVDVIAVTRCDDGRDPYGNIVDRIATDHVNDVISELATIPCEPSCSFFDGWKDADLRARETITEMLEENPDSEPSLFAQLGEMLRDAVQSQVLVASSMPIRYAEWLWERPSENVSIYSHRGTNGIDGMVSSAYGIAHATQDPTLCIVGDVAFAHDIGFLTQSARLARLRSECVIYFVVDNGGGAIFRHLDQAKNESLHDSYEELFQTQPQLDIAALSSACGAQYYSGLPNECVEATRNIIQSKVFGVHVVHARVEHDSGPAFIQQLHAAVAGPTS